MSNLYMENWDSYMENPAFSFDSWSFQQEEEDLMSFPENFEPDPNFFDEVCTELNPYCIPVLEDHVEEQPENRKQQLSVSGFAFSGANKDSEKPKRSRFSRKNQKNRVVQHVKADDLPSDIWAWRKYGQKPIKGSPHPRSYYRCSSSKGCLARKQVERSCTDPGVFIITYTAEHSHGHPTRRNTLSGTTRNKSSTATKTLADKNELLHEEEETVLVSPTNTSNESVEQEISVKMEELQQMLEEVDQRDKSLTQNILLSEELVQSFENFEFEGLFLDQFPDL